MRPIIGISSQYELEPRTYVLRAFYIDFIERAGGIPIIMPPTEDEDSLRRILAFVDGVLLPGGCDIDAHLYGFEPLPTDNPHSTVRDNGELTLLRIVEELDMPVLGICRGSQIMNVYYGGTLYQDLPTQTETPLVHLQYTPGEPIEWTRTSHTIQPVEGTPLADLVGMDPFSVNSFHHQGIRTLAEPLKPMGFAPDGLIESVYNPNRTFFWAMQWHPECFSDADVDSAIAKAFIEAAIAFGASRR